jgi:DNA-binding protein HU-beta
MLLPRATVRNSGRRSQFRPARAGRIRFTSEHRNRLRRSSVNKAELINALSIRLGDRKVAASALDAILSEIQFAVARGESVKIPGFGTFERRARAARTARHPRTGSPVEVAPGLVPVFRPGAVFKGAVASGKIPRATARMRTATSAAAARKRSGRTTAAAKKTTARATKSSPSKAAASKKPPGPRTGG